MANTKDKNKQNRQNGKKQNDKRLQARREFIGKVGAIGALAVVSTSSAKIASGKSENVSQERPVVGIDSKVGVVTLNHAAVRVIAQQLRVDMGKDSALKERFLENPREVLGSRGINEELQREILRVDTDFKSSESPFFAAKRNKWCITTRCCCTTCCLSCWFTNIG